MAIVTFFWALILGATVVVKSLPTILDMKRDEHRARLEITVRAARHELDLAARDADL